MYDYIGNSYENGKVESAETPAVLDISLRGLIEKKE